MTQEESDKKVVELCDVQFLAKLTEVARLYGWSASDYYEVANFIEGLYGLVGQKIEIQSLEPYDIEYCETKDDEL